MSLEEKSQLKYEINVDVLPASGFSVKFEASEEECQKVAIEADLLEVKSLKVDLLFRRWRRDGIELKGRIYANVVQPCVITLEPVPSSFVEEVEHTFLPEGSKLAKPRLNEDGEMVLDPDGADIPDLFAGKKLDVWEIILEHLLLGLDPFPRSEGADLSKVAGKNVEVDAADKTSPFAQLSKLNLDKKD
ncbi:MAG: DUF177 domain-containing protein [Nitratireductor sp.]